MKVLLLGTPGASRGAQAQFITTALGILQTSIGDMLRAAIKTGTPLGLEAKRIINEGGSVCDSIIIGMVKKHIVQGDYKSGFLLGGFPRTSTQAEAMVETGVDLDVVVKIDVPDSVIVDHMGSRRMRLTSGRTYHVTYNPPKVEGKDDIAGEDLIQHDNDKEGIVKKRLAVYREQTGALVDFCSKLEGGHAPKYIKVDDTQIVEAAKAEVLKGLGK